MASRLLTPPNEVQHLIVARVSIRLPAAQEHAYRNDPFVVAFEMDISPSYVQSTPNTIYQ